ncbi:MAG: hypothetical protein JXM71_07325 [Spirochaetales bacterium]|nr:hypothetical protein [Spirochaetales bacterium]
MMRAHRALYLVAALVLAATGTAAHGDEYYSDWGFSVDLPEGFQVVDGDGATRFTFGSADGVVIVDIAVLPPSRFVTAEAGALDTVKKLSGTGSFSQLDYSGTEAACGEIKLGAGTKALNGYGLFVNDAEKPGLPEEPAESYDLIVLSYAPAASYARYRDIVASAIDGFSMRYTKRAVPGPLGVLARSRIPATAPVSTATIPFGKATVTTDWSPAEAAVAQELVEREYRVLSPYGSSPELVEAAVARFYRMVYRDAAPSLDRLALQLSAAWETGAWSGSHPSPALLEKPAPGPRFGISAEPRGYAAALLSWVQNFEYERDPKGSDVVNPISAAFEARGDCDSRALVLSILLERENVDTILLVSLEHSHALSAIDAPGPGARFPYKERKWLVAETTAKVDIGLIDAAQSSIDSWLPVEFPY